MNLVRHEIRHLQGQEHERMTYEDEWSLGPLPQWAEEMERRGMPRYLGRAPNQL